MTLPEGLGFKIAVILGALTFAMTSASLLTWGERRLLGLFQDRKGPNRVGPLGIGIIPADVIKLMFKEDWTPPFSDRPVFVLAPAIAMVMVLMSFSVVPFGEGLVVSDSAVGVLLFLAFSSLSVYGVILGGWASHSKYSLLGGMRAASQMVSYEVFMGLALMGVVARAGSFSLVDIVESQRGLWNCVPQVLGFGMFVIAALAETHRAPFDLPEADSELVAGFRTEYSSMKFAMFMLTEYLGITMVSSLITTFYLGGWLGPFADGPWWFLLKTFAVVVFIVCVRAALPRPRFDQLLSYGWKVILPVALLNLVVTGAAILLLDGGAA
jgi:NADH-quinone oxidoreductase subunit H